MAKTVQQEQDFQQQKMILCTIVYILVQREASGQINPRQIQSAKTPTTTVVNLGTRGPSASSLSMAFFFCLLKFKAREKALTLPTQTHMCTHTHTHLHSHRHTCIHTGTHTPYAHGVLSSVTVWYIVQLHHNVEV